ncbi:hypothetical protein KDH_66500 [Dictyobacter sp. S3.2.2.5]|uniref:DUF3893 domain-containing protein n=1 Tax=Dictyobacter halimunensis TaxID=3026934 RepID=A0ABQ6FZY9_9CHLR|nr:hypothetical protein KDH_66500 [Dictyobacter sp. S3.2.2.5]
MDTFSQIVPMRFRIDEAHLRNLAVSFSKFAYEQDCLDFLECMKRLSSRDHPENPPYRRLNTVLTALAPTLAHPFIVVRNVDTQQSERQMLVVGADVTRRPKPEQMSDLLYEWGNQWGQNSFAKVINGAGKDAHQRLLDRLQEPAQQWQEIDAASLFLNLDAGTRAGYRAIPSVLGSLLAGKQSRINGRIVTWRLAQDGDAGLAVISNPFRAEFEDEHPITHVKEIKTGTFAYKLEFRLQTQVGSPHRWLHLYVRCSRYVDRHLRDANWNRDVSVKVGINQPRLSGWGWSPALVTLPLTGGVTNPRWQDDPAQLLSAIKARDLVAPDSLLQAPPDYRVASSRSMYDEYFVLHAEGLKPKHKVKTGFDFAELREVANTVSDILGLELSAGQTLVADIPIRQMYRPQLPLMMYGRGELEEKKFVKKQPQASDEAREHQNRLERQKLILSALRRAANNQRISIVLCCSDTISQKILEQEIRRDLFMEMDEPWPEHIKLIIPPTPIPDTLLAPLDQGQLNPLDHYKKFPIRSDRQKYLAEWKAQMRAAFREKTRAWENYLNRLLPAESGCVLALIGLHKLDPKKTYPDQHIKGAVRRACNELGWASQMLFLPLKLDKKGVTTESKARAHNSVVDLIYRQTSLVYDRPYGLYLKAGIPQEQAEHLHVIALFKLRKYEPRMDYPMAVRLCPDGTFQALLPHKPQQWLPFMEARQELGKILMRGKRKDIYLEKDAQAHFAAQVFTKPYNEPTLVLFEAQDWRNRGVLPQFANGKTALKDQLDLTHVKTFERVYHQRDFPNLRIIRIRTLGSGETPQYFAIQEDDEGIKEDKDLGHLTGFIDTQVESEFFHYLSVGRLPTTAAKEQRGKPGLYKTDEGGGIAFKHQTIVEFVPFFLQEKDNPQAWCHIPHFLRISPGWDGGNIILPYPMHLAKCMIEDQLCILDGGLNEEEV